MINALFTALIIMVLAYLLPGITVSGFFAAIVLAVVLAVLNALVKPILVLLTLPLTILTLGLFLFVINTILVLIANMVVPGFHVDGFGSALLFSILLSVTKSILLP